MAFSRELPMYYLREHRGVKAGTPVGRVKPRDIARLRMLAAHGVIGTQEDLMKLPEAEPASPSAEESSAVKRVQEVQEADVTVEISTKPKKKKR